MSDCKCQVNISKYLQKLFLGSREKENLPQKPISARDARTVRGRKESMCPPCTHLQLSRADHLLASWPLYTLTCTCKELTKDHSQAPSRAQPYVLGGLGLPQFPAGPTGLCFPEHPWLSGWARSWRLQGELLGLQGVAFSFPPLWNPASHTTSPWLSDRTFSS